MAIRWGTTNLSPFFGDKLFDALEQHGVILGNRKRRGAVVVEDALGKCLLARFEDLDLLLDRANGDEFVNEDRLVLADPLRPVDRLVLNGRIPPRI